VTISTRARHLALGVGLIVALGALSLAAPGSSTTERHPASAIITARDLSPAPNASRPTRSIRLALLAALLSAALMAAIAVDHVSRGRSRPARRRTEQFFARRRGPPILLVAH